jgi:hypothetical protein
LAGTTLQAPFKPTKPVWVGQLEEVVATPEVTIHQVDIALDKLFVSALNARKDLHAGQEDSGIDELGSSIRRQGLLSPPIVRPTPDSRWAAATARMPEDRP